MLQIQDLTKKDKKHEYQTYEEKLFANTPIINLHYHIKRAPISTAKLSCHIFEMSILPLQSFFFIKYRTWTHAYM